MWRTTLSVGLVLTWLAWVAAFVLVALAWWVDIVYVGHVGLVMAALGGTLTLCREHHRTRRHVYAVGLAGRDPIDVPATNGEPVVTRPFILREP